MLASGNEIDTGKLFKKFLSRTELLCSLRYFEAKLHLVKSLFCRLTRTTASKADGGTAMSHNSGQGRHVAVEKRFSTQ